MYVIASNPVRMSHTTLLHQILYYEQSNTQYILSGFIPTDKG